eukprot:282969_1
MVCILKEQNTVKYISQNMKYGDVSSISCGPDYYVIGCYKNASSFVINNHVHVDGETSCSFNFSSALEMGEVSRPVKATAVCLNKNYLINYYQNTYKTAIPTRQDVQYVYCPQSTIALSCGIKQSLLYNANVTRTTLVDGGILVDGVCQCSSYTNEQCYAVCGQLPIVTKLSPPNIWYNEIIFDGQANTTSNHWTVNCGTGYVAVSCNGMKTTMQNGTCICDKGSGDSCTATCVSILVLLDGFLVIQNTSTDSVNLACDPGYNIVGCSSLYGSSSYFVDESTCKCAKLDSDEAETLCTATCVDSTKFQNYSIHKNNSQYAYCPINSKLAPISCGIELLEDVAANVSVHKEYFTYYANVQVISGCYCIVDGTTQFNCYAVCGDLSNLSVSSYYEYEPEVTVEDIIDVNVTVEDMMDDNDRDTTHYVLIVTWTLIFIILVVIALLVYIKIRKQRNTSKDDQKETVELEKFVGTTKESVSIEGM